MKSALKLSVLLAAAAVASCTPPQGGDGGDTLRIAIARFQQETCTFCPGGDTDIARWTRIREPYKGDEIFEAGAYIRGFVSSARSHRGVELVGLESPADVFGSSSGSWTTEEAFEHFMGLILSDLREAMPVDAVYLALHGAMAVRNVPRPEAEIARRVREIVGPDVPIAGTFDLHGNEDGEFLRWANFTFTTKRYPHYDAYIQGERAARALIATARGEYTPTTATRKPGVITATVVQWTGQSPSMDIMERARRWESREDDAYVSVFYGYPWSDVPDVGATVSVMTDGDQELADRIADDMSDFIWRVREGFAGGVYPMPDEAAREVRRAVAAGAVPVALGDYSDRSGDATWLIKELVGQGVGNTLYGTLRDERVLDALVEGGAQVGDPFDMEVGGFMGPASGTPVRVTGTLVYLGPAWDYEWVAAIEFGDHNLLYVTPAYEQILYPEALSVGPVNADDYDVFVVKSRVHFRRGFDETGYARTILVVDAPGPFIGTTRLDALDYEFAPIDRLYPFGTPEGRD